MTVRPLLLVYDGDCSFCEAASRWLVGRGSRPHVIRRPFQAFEGDEAERLLAAGIRDELVVVDADGAVRTGASALVDLLPASARALLRRAPLRWLVAGVYRLVAANRRVLAPVSPARRARCACDPSPRPLDRAVFVVLLLALGTVGAAASGVAVAGETDAASPREGARLGLLAFALGWGPLLGAAGVRGGARRGERVAHVAWLAAVLGLCWLLAVGVGLALHLVVPGAWHGALLYGLLVVVAALAGWRAARRARVLGWSPRQLLLGAACVVGGVLLALALA